MLVVFRGQGPEAYPGIVAGWEQLAAKGEIQHFEHLAIDTKVPPDPARVWSEICNRVVEGDLDTLVLHHFHTQMLGDPRPWLEQLRKQVPNLFITTLNGDAFTNGYLGRPAPPKMLLQAAEMSDLVLTTSMGTLGDLLARHATAPVVWQPNGVFPERFQVPVPLGQPDFDVVFIGSNNRSRNLLKPYHWMARRRERMIRGLASRFGARLGVFGHGWEGVPGWQGPVPFNKQWGAARRGKVVVGGVPFSTNRYYLSNRPFIQIAAGVPFVDLRVDGIGLILRDGEHWHLGDDIDSLIDLCSHFVSLPDDEWQELGRAAADEMLERHTEPVRVRSTLNTIRAVQASRRVPVSPVRPDLSAFLPEVDVAAELPLATRNWPAASEQRTGR
ncbi:MAG: glycosyltransferase [Acidimicrobiales bacterium]|nr:glycosyltransferase [Acidimicrobiales bacterium]